jgi:uncharacterized protein YjiS (DUF1127 family)
MLLALLRQMLCRFVLVRGLRRAARQMPDDLLRELGLTRNDIAFAGCESAFGRGERCCGAIA